jgi:hypothetical protein
LMNVLYPKYRMDHLLLLFSKKIRYIIFKKSFN